MRELKDEFRRLGQEYREQRYHGDLAELLSTSPPQRRGRLVRWTTAGMAAGMAIAAALLLAITIWPSTPQHRLTEKQQPSVPQARVEQPSATELATNKSAATVAPRRRFRYRPTAPKRPRIAVRAAVPKRPAVRPARPPAFAASARALGVAKRSRNQLAASRRTSTRRLFSPRIDRPSIDFSLSLRRSIDGV